MIAKRFAIVVFTALLFASCGDTGAREPEPGAKVRREPRDLCTLDGLTYSAGAVVVTQEGRIRCWDGKWEPVELPTEGDAASPDRSSSPRN